MKRIILSLAAIAILGLAAAALARGHHRALVASHMTSHGTILVNRHGYTLYVFERDRKRKDNCVKIPGCLQVWPAFTTKGKPIAGSGVRKSLLGWIKVKGRRQVTYAGHPLYTYIGDSQPAETSYIGLNQSGGRWWAITPSGKLVK